MKMKKRMRILAPTLMTAIISSNSNAEIIKGMVETKKGISIPYIYETEFNSFGINVEQLINVKKDQIKYDPADENLCDHYRNYLKITKSESSESKIKSHFNSTHQLQIRYTILDEYDTPEISDLVYRDLREKTTINSTPTNETNISVEELKPVFKWSPESITSLAGQSVKQSTEEKIMRSFEIDRKNKRINVEISMKSVLPNLICDLQQEKVDLQIEYSIPNRFYYNKTGELKKDFFMKVWGNINERKDEIMKFSKKTDFLTYKESQVLTNGIFLTHELFQNGKNPILMDPKKVELIYLDMFNREDGSVNKYYTEKDAENRSKSFGTTITVKIATHKGVARP